MSQRLSQLCEWVQNEEDEPLRDKNDHGPIEILLVEDDPGDVDLILETLGGCAPGLKINVVQDGVKAMQYLHRQHEYSDRKKPHLILLDLNMPRKDGREVLKDLKSDPGFKSIPVVVMTTSSADDDISKAYRYGANCYITKPLGLAEFTKVVGAIENFWFSIVRLPPL